MAENTEKKPNIFKRMGMRIAKFWRDFSSETKKIAWMPRNEVVKNTVLVISWVIIISAVIGLLDYGFSSAINALGRLY